MTKDYLNKYKKNKIISNLSIIITSLIIALSINFLILDNSNFWKNLKSSVLEAQEQNKKADLYLENNKWNLILKNSKNINQAKSLSFSISYNPENVEITNIECNSNELIKIENTPWIKAIIINYKTNKDIKSKSKICKIKYNKKENKSEQLNLINSNFTDKTWEVFLLSTSWITF
jgi:hypothetical protein